MNYLIQIHMQLVMLGQGSEYRTCGLVQVYEVDSDYSRGNCLLSRNIERTDQ